MKESEVRPGDLFFMEDSGDVILRIFDEKDCYFLNKTTGKWLGCSKRLGEHYKSVYGWEYMGNIGYWGENSAEDGGSYQETTDGENMTEESILEEEKIAEESIEKTLDDSGVVFTQIPELLGKIFHKVGTEEKDRLCFRGSEESYMFYHSQSCCEQVCIDDIVGDLSDLEGSPILMAEEATKKGNDDGMSQTWTFYKFATIKGYVDVKWLGESNGYYSESVDFEKI